MNAPEIIQMVVPRTVHAREMPPILLEDKISGLGIDVHEGVVTLSGHLANASDRQKAIDDTRKVPGVKSVVNRIDVP